MIWYDGKMNRSTIDHIVEDLHIWEVIHNYIPPEKCKEIIKNREYWNVSKGMVFNDGPRELAIDARDVTQFTPGGELNWLIDQVWSTVQRLNTKYWKFDIEGLIERPTLLHYEEKGHYVWHMDVGKINFSSQRKLSFVLLLNDEFEGGNLRIFLGGTNDQVIPLSVGSLVVFPSYMLHTVEEVTEGNRYVYQGFIDGNSFR
jgi:hypothetical protein